MQSLMEKKKQKTKNAVYSVTSQNFSPFKYFGVSRKPTSIYTLNLRVLYLIYREYVVPCKNPIY